VDAARLAADTHRAGGGGVSGEVAAGVEVIDPEGAAEPVGSDGRPAPRGRRERTKAENHAAILRAARETFAELGYEGSSIRDVVRRTGLASGTFYNYFPDKESVLRALLEDRASELRDRLRAARTGAVDFEAFVRDAYRVYFSFLAEDPAMLALLRRNAGAVRALAGEPELAAGIDDLLGDLRAVVASGAAPPFDVEYMAAAMAGAGFEIAVRMLAREPHDIKGAATFAAGLFLGGAERLATAGSCGAEPLASAGVPRRRFEAVDGRGGDGAI